MSDLVTLTQELEAVLRAHGAAPRDLNSVFQVAHTSFRQFPPQLDESMLGELFPFF